MIQKQQQTLPNIYVEHSREEYVSARNLHSCLNFDEEFTPWCNHILKYFLDKTRYKKVRIGTGSAHQKTDYLIALDGLSLFMEIATMLLRKKIKRVQKKLMVAEDRLLENSDHCIVVSMCNYMS